MTLAQVLFTQAGSPLRTVATRSLWWLLAALAAPAILTAQSAYLVRVPVPITGTVDTRVIRSLERIAVKIAEQRLAEGRPTVVLEFWPPDDETQGSDSSFERALALARYLAGPQFDGIRTVAYVPRTVVGHAVLPVVACEQIVIAPDAKLGRAGLAETSIPASLQGFYREIASRRRTIPVAVVMGMLDPKLTVYKVTTDRGVRYELEQDLPAVRERENVQTIDTLIPAGDAGEFTGRSLRLDLGFASHLASTRRELATALGVEAELLEPDPSLGSDWKPLRVDLDGLITEKKVDRLIRMIDDPARSGTTNFICLVINSSGGSAEASLRLAGYLSDLDSSQVRTVAYIVQEALGDVALIPLACDQVVLQHGAVWGGPGAIDYTPEDLDAIRPVVQQITRQKSRSWSWGMGLIDSRLELRRYNLEGTSVSELWTETEWKEQADPDRWKQGEVASPAGEYLRLDAASAERWRVVNFVTEGIDDLRTAYQIEGPLLAARASWADEFIEFLARPQLAVMLLFFAGFALMAELSSPGLGIGGFVSAVCFMLFFWSQFLHGTATWLEILLFLTGVACIVAEIFVIPGTGVFGFGGGLLVLAALVLASQTFLVPRNEYQLSQMVQSLMPVVAAGAGVTLGIVLLRKYLEKAPFLRHVMLKPPEGRELLELQRREMLADLQPLLGKRGRTMTPIMPYGKARIGDQLVDVMTESDLIEKGAEVEVTQVQAHRVVVREVRGPHSPEPR